MKRRLKDLVIRIANGNNPMIYSSFGYSNSKLFLLKIKVFANLLFFRLFNLGISDALVGTQLAHNSEVGKSAIVFGNGPSANFVDTKLLAIPRRLGELSVILVNFALLDENWKLHGCDYLVLSDPDTHPDADNKRNKLLWEIISNMKDLRVITPTGWHKNKNLYECEKSTCLHFNDSTLETISKNISPLKPRGYASLTAYKALAYTIHLGFKKIAIAGIDNSNYKFVTVTEDNHIIQLPHHFTPDYAPARDITALYPFGIADYFYDISLMFRSLEVFKGYNIVNLGKGSEVDIFPKMNLEEFLR